MSSSSCGSKEQNKKTPLNNQWTGTGAAGKSSDYQDKTEFSNEWVSTNKVATDEKPNPSKKSNKK